MKILSIDTSTSAGSIVLSDGERLIGEVNVDSEQTHSVRLLRGIETLLASAGLPLGSLDAFGVVCGPGSFTGIRIGLATIKGLAESLSKPVIPISALEAWVEKFPGQQGVIVPVIDARRGEVYAAVYRRSAQTLELLSPGVVQKAVAFFAGIAHPEACFVGCGACRYRPTLLTYERPGWSIVASDAFLSRPMARIAWQSAQRGKFVLAAELQAGYLRLSDAELNWKER